jgi:hypothetical protein
MVLRAESLRREADPFQFTSAAEEVMSFQFERLENRVLLAASVTQRGGNLVIHTDGEEIEVIGVDTGEVDVFADGDQVNDTFEGVRNIRIIGNSDDDVVFVGAVEISGNLRVETGAGEDFVGLNGSFGKNVNVNLGRDGDFDTVFVADELHVGRNLDIRTGDGGSVVDFFGEVEVGKNLNVRTGDGDDSLYAGYSGAVSVGGNAKANTDGGDDFVGIYELFSAGKNVNLNLGNGDDYVYAEEVSLGKATINGHRGEDTLETFGDVEIGRLRLRGIEDVIEA